MRRTNAIPAGLLAAALLAAPALAGPLYTGDTELLGAATSGSTLWVDASITSAGPVVPYEFAIRNECRLPERGGRTYQRDAIAEWTYHENGIPHAVLPVYLQAVPAGSRCEVVLVRGNTTLKGSATTYVVGAPSP